ncbi:hypothetical protein BJY00DRAFT_308936 [Aspergillus carlsbadensis]|nr:hypothetical protein BJY00DRAFT_308936 [Aspergillus carlsbadensis]
MRPADVSAHQEGPVAHGLSEGKQHKRVQKYGSQQADEEKTTSEGRADRKAVHDSPFGWYSESGPRTGHAEDPSTSETWGERSSASGESSWLSYLPFSPSSHTARAGAMDTLAKPFSTDLGFASTDGIFEAEPKSGMEDHALDWKKDGIWAMRDAEYRQASIRFESLHERYSDSGSRTERMRLHKSLVATWKTVKTSWEAIMLWRQKYTADYGQLKGFNWPQRERKWLQLKHAYERHLQEYLIYEIKPRMAHQDDSQDPETRDSTGEMAKEQSTPLPLRERPRSTSPRHWILSESAIWIHEPVNESNADPSDDDLRLPLARCEAQTVTAIARPNNNHGAVTRRTSPLLYSDALAHASSDDDDSTDTDCLSITVDSEPDLAGAVASEAVIEYALRHILREYRAGKQCGQTEDNGKGKTVVRDQAPPCRTPTSLGMKHGRDEETSTDGSSSPFALTKKTKTGKEQQNALACPFWKRNPREYRKCFQYRLSRIRDVKQHIHRRHHPPWRCMRCGEIFPSEETRDAHARADQACAVRHVAHDDLSQSQMKALTRRANTRYTVEEQWYAIWDILFPGAERPASPYIDGMLSEEISSFQEFYQTRGPAILREALRESHRSGTSTQEVEQYSDLVLRAALDRILDRWLSSQTDDASLSSAQPVTSATLSPSSENNVVSSTSDSQPALIGSAGDGASNMTQAGADPGSSSFPFTIDPGPGLDDSAQIDFAAWCAAIDSMQSRDPW